MNVKKAGLFVGRVWSNKMQKTITVAVNSQRWVERYKVMVRKTTKLKAHDENNICDEGDLVEIRHSRRRSKTKTFELVRILKKVAGKEEKWQHYKHPSYIPSIQENETDQSNQIFDNLDKIAKNISKESKEYIE